MSVTVRVSLMLSNQSLALQQQNNVMNDPMNFLLTNINNQIRLQRFLIRIVNPRKSLNIAPPSSCINSLTISSFLQLVPFTILERYSIFKRSSNMNQVEASELRDKVTGCFTTRFEGGNGGCDDCCSCTRKFCTYECNASDVFGTILSGEA